jgi:hypothetical protein
MTQDQVQEFIENFQKRHESESDEEFIEWINQ